LETGRSIFRHDNFQNHCLVLEIRRLWSWNLLFVITIPFIKVWIHNLKALVGANLVEELPKKQNASSV